ncbi:MAG: T9SS type A sorting domain-containing protein [Bacteroidota bacterium]
MRSLVLAILLAPLSLVAQPQLARITAEVGPRGPQFVRDGRPVTFVPFDGRAAFSGLDTSGDWAVWLTDGTEAGTVKRIPENGGGPAVPSAPLAAFEDRLYFSGLDADNRNRLWRIAATGLPEQVTLAEYEPGTFAAQPDRFFFTGCTPDEGCEPYVSNGQSTSLLQDIHPGPTSSEARGYTLWQGATYFEADDGSTGEEVWRTAGTEGTTTLLANLYRGATGSRVGGFLPTGNLLLFVAEGRASGESAMPGIYGTDGTEAGTSLVVGAGLATSFLGTAGAEDTPIVAFADPTFGREPHALTGGSLVFLADIRAGGGSLAPGTGSRTARLGDHLAFTAEAFVSPTLVDQIWLTDGQTASRIEIPDEPAYAEYRNPVTLDGSLYFTVVPNETLNQDAPQQIWRFVPASGLVGGGAYELIGTLPDGALLQGWNAFDGGLLMGVSLGVSGPVELWGIGYSADTAGTEASASAALSLRVAPNPIRGATRLGYTLTEAGEVRLTVFDALGRSVATLVDTARPAGEHHATWDSSGFPAGMYLVRLHAMGGEATRTVTVVR